MYACICNGLKDKDVRTAARAGAGTVGQVFKSLNCKPSCATCVGCIRDVLEDELVPRGELMAAE